MRSWLCQNAPGLFRFLPGSVRLFVIRRHLGPQAAWLMRERFDAGVEAILGAHLRKATAEDGKVRLSLRMPDGTTRDVVSDHVIAATGYWPDVDRFEFLGDRMRAGLKTHQKMPVVSRSFETSISGFYLVGPPAVNSFGPLMRFMVGAEYVAPLVAERLAGRVRRAESVRRVALA